MFHSRGACLMPYNVFHQITAVAPASATKVRLPNRRPVWRRQRLSSLSPLLVECRRAKHPNERNRHAPRRQSRLKSRSRPRASREAQTIAQGARFFLALGRSSRLCSCRRARLAASSCSQSKGCAHRRGADPFEGSRGGGCLRMSLPDGHRVRRVAMTATLTAANAEGRTTEFR